MVTIFAVKLVCSFAFNAYFEQKLILPNPILSLDYHQAACIGMIRPPVQQHLRESVKSTYASVHFNQIGTPVADNFDDVYFSNDSGMDETQYVFVEGNDLSARWLSCQQTHFVIAETGFGTGLNLLVVMTAFRQFRLAHPDHPLTQLYFISTEKFPLSQADMTNALARFTSLSEAAQALNIQYPFGLQGCHRLMFDAFSTTVDLWFADVHEAMAQWNLPPQGLVDAWFLDGFAPSKNPQMWTEELFSNMARCSKPKATCATFTAAGLVKRGLHNAGFKVTKRAGFGRKREMITAIYQPEPNTPQRAGVTKTRALPEQVAIIGGGIAAATLAYSLCKRGVTTSLYCATTFADGASGNPQGGFYPQLHAQASLASQLQAHAFMYARRFYDEINQHHAFVHDFCGVLQLAFNEQTSLRQQKLISNDVWPEQLIHAVDRSQAEVLAGVHLPYSGLFIPEGGWINPPSLINALIALSNLSGNLSLHLHHRLQTIDEQEGHVSLKFSNGNTVDTPQVVLATGHELADISHCTNLPLRPVRGQVEAIPTQESLSKLKTVLCHKGYLTPAFQGRHALGSTYVKRDTDTAARATESEQNLQLHQQALSLCNWVQNLEHDNRARAAVRLGVPDHQPLCGTLPDDEMYRHWENSRSRFDTALPAALTTRRIKLFSALGSRGLTSAPLLADVLASELSHHPSPLSKALLKTVNPNRFVLKALKRN